ncbi:MAG: hypothetical protein Q9192_004123, partial [Flavoplaca navasiana]
MGDARLDYLFHHVFLPTQLPQRSDIHDGQGDQALVDALLETLDSFRRTNDVKYYQQWSTVQRSLRTFKLLHSRTKSLSRSALETAFRDAANGEIIILHIALQNSAVLMQRKEKEYVVESFETSPQSADVLAASGALQWDFPSRAVTIPSHTFEDPFFRAELATFLEKASVEPVKQYTATTLKADSNAYESRDTTFPAIIGQLLITILEASGQKHTSALTQKRVRDDVCWSDGAVNPWRRSAAWLVLRVSIQRILCSLLGPHGTLHYKFFMCSLLCSLSDKFFVQESFPADRLVFAKAKLARRVAKLESLGAASSPEVSTLVHSLLGFNEKTYLETLRALERVLENRAIRLRASHTRKIMRLPQRAPPDSTNLSMRHSWEPINEILTEIFYGGPRAQIILPQSQPRAAQYARWVNNPWPDEQLSPTDFLCLADMEGQLAEAIREAQGVSDGNDSEDIVTKLKQQMAIYQLRACKAYKENAEQLSHMILTLMEIWVALDQLVVRRYPLLGDYDHGFPSDLLHPLKIAKISGMHRLMGVEEYLDRRRRRSIYPLSDVLGEFNKHSFAVRFFDHCVEMQRLSSTIWRANEHAKAKKERELIERSNQYEALMKQISITTCLFMEDHYDPLRRQHDDRRCRKCYLEREASRMRIGIYEDLLPADEVQAKAVVFELLLPSDFAAWRDSVWGLFTLSRGVNTTDQNQDTSFLVREYEGLKPFVDSLQSTVTLASWTKSFYRTHYRPVPFPVQLDQVCVPHGLKYRMYDHETRLWTNRHLNKPSFATLCSFCLPAKSAWISVKRYLHPTFEDVEPSGNEVVASQTRCPNNLTVAEYSSFQDLRIGTRIKWIKLLRELASTNTNFGSVETTMLVTELALGVGPAGYGHVLRATHWVFRNQSFCQKLAASIRTRLQAVATNWREGQIVECLVVLVQRLWFVGQTVELIKEAQELMLLVRNITNNWIRLLRQEISNAINLETAQTRSRESLHAALLCRKTFVLEAASSDPGFEHAALACFLECAFTIKDNLSLSEKGDMNTMPAALRRLYVSDLKLLHSLEPQIRWSLHNVQMAVSAAVNSVWTDSVGPSARRFSRWTVLPAPQDSWCTARSLGGEGILEQRIDFNFLEGTLYIDGQLLGRLPEEFARQDFFQKFFGDRIFLTRPSYLEGMSYMFVSLVERHEVHFGFRNGYRFMRVTPQSSMNTVLEFLPASIFLGNDAPDLPLPLINDHVHWLDLHTGVIEVRPQATMWRAKDSDWRIFLATRKGLRRGRSELVDPRSPLFGQIAQVIEPFENRTKMIIYQPLNLKSNLTVDLPGLELKFEVRHDRLESRHLRAYIDIDQDAGTMYGLKSSLVLRDSVHPEKRSILVAMGPACIQRQQDHVNVLIDHTGYYARFLINQLLGRLECAPEPRLLIFKALCHAVTSSVHPDPLTGRTGTEEALACLEAANAQPWAPLDSESYRMLFEIADLTPARIYYPEKSKFLQKVLWDDNLMPASQAGNFRPLVEDILQQCAALHKFHLESGAATVYKRQGNMHLHSRALSRAQEYLPAQHSPSEAPPGDVHYVPRDSVNTASCRNAYQAAAHAWRWSLDIRVNSDLAARLQEWPLIQGYLHTFEAQLLSSLINFEAASNWGSLFRLCQQVKGTDEKAKLMFLFGTLAFGGQIDITLLNCLIAIAIMDESKDLDLPQCAEFVQFRRNQIPTVDFLAQYIRPCKIPYPEDERALLAVRMHGKQRRKLEWAQRTHEEASENECKAFTECLLSQWPAREAPMMELPDFPLLDVQNARIMIRSEWERLSDNYQLSEHVINVQKLLDRCKTPVNLKRTIGADNQRDFYPIWKSPSRRLRMVDLLYQPLKEVPPVNANEQAKETSSQLQWAMKLRSVISENRFTSLESSTDMLLQHVPLQHHGPDTKVELSEIISQFSTSRDPVRSAYGQDLKRSLDALCKSKFDDTSQSIFRVDTRELNEAISTSRKEIQAEFEYIRESMTAGYKWLKMGGLLPVFTPLTLLETLRNGARAKSRETIQAHILSYAESLVKLQQLLRIQGAHRQDDNIQLGNERCNVAHTGWKPEDHIDWLLLEIDFNLIIRADQLHVAQAMIASPSTISNFVLQMNMGQGKSSVIIPMVATALAKEENLVRVVVPRSLLLQAAQLLSSRLGGLINRRIKHIPFSRKSRTDIESIKAYRELHRDLHKRRGVLLALPEHLLSFRLSGLQELSNGRSQESTYMIKLQAWFARKARDILDECDHMLAVKTQLIYPSGAQSPVDGHPTRWKLVQGVLRLAKTHINHLRRDNPKSVEVIDRVPGAFPTVYFIHQHIKDTFITRLTDRILAGDGGLLPIQECSSDELRFAADFLRHAQFARTTAGEVAQVFRDKKDTRLQLLLLRGMLVHKILLMGLSKRWNVQYGIHPYRDPVAVPFRSKGIPSDQAEFGHPDVSILLTCLSFYNTGLTLVQFRQSLGLLLKSDEPVAEFESWISGVRSFPESLSSFASINIDDETQCLALWEYLRLQMTAVNFFLNHFVFPRYAKTFDRKLVSSGWDIATPLRTSHDAVGHVMKENKQPGATSQLSIQGAATALTVGFSGTNDNKTLLPLNVLQNDLPGLLHTNADVLTYLLQPRNRRYVPACDRRGKRVSETAFLHMLKDRGIRMLLDAGAQIIKLDNIALAKTWLSVDTQAEAAVFFGVDERARVVYRDGKEQPLAASPFLDNLGACVVYLDEAHTRGVDLKMPPQAVAALTLGVMQTKDHTVQAAMRLRQLAVSQSVIFFAPPEVHQSIYFTRSRSRYGPINSHDVIVWLLEQTCCNIEQLQPLYVSQGLEFCRRRIAAQRYEESGYNFDNSRPYLKVLEQPERYSLEELYAPDRKIKSAPIQTSGNAEISGYVKRLDALKAEIRNTGDTMQALAHQEVEQEREVAIEVESVREVKKPHHAQAASHSPLHRDVRSFAETGRLVAGSHVCIQAFVALRKTAVGRRLGISDNATRYNLYITQDYSVTVVPDRSGLPRDEYSRPVNWVVWSPSTSTGLIVSDYEANILLPLIPDTSPPVTYLIT